MGVLFVQASICFKNQSIWLHSLAANLGCGAVSVDVWLTTLLYQSQELEYNIPQELP